MPRPQRTDPYKLVQLKIQPHFHEMLRQLAIIGDTTMSLLVEKMIAEKYSTTALTLKPVEVPTQAEWVAVPKEPDPEINERFALVDPEPVPAPKKGRAKPASQPELFPASDIPDI